MSSQEIDQQKIDQNDLQASLDMISEGSPTQPQQSQKQPRRKVYIAGPLFNNEENNCHNRPLAKALREKGYEVFNPIDDGTEGAASEKEGNELIIEIHDGDVEEILSSDIFIANLNGPHTDPGTAYECSKADSSQLERNQKGLSQGVEVMIAYLNDTRWLTQNMKRDPMSYRPFLRSPNIVLETREEIVKYVLANFPPRNSVKDTT